MTVFGGREKVASRAEMLRNGTVRSQEPLGLSWQFKPLDISFSLARPLVGVLGAIVQIRLSQHLCYEPQTGSNLLLSKELELHHSCFQTHDTASHTCR